MKKTSPLFLVLIGLLGAFAVAQTPIGVDDATFSGLKVYPNPWRADLHRNSQVRFAPLPDGSTVEIFTLSGHSVKRFGVSSHEADWDCTNDSGDDVASGVYLYLIKNAQGNKTTGKIAVIR
jgi:hypothetical protein